MFILFFVTLSIASEEVVVDSEILSSPLLFEKTIQAHIEKNYESEHYINFKDAKDNEERLKFCNPKKDIKDPYSFRGNFKICMKYFVFDIWGGSGVFSIQGIDTLGRKQTLSGNAPFVGGQIIYPYRLNQNFILEGKYWYLPSFSVGASAVENFRKSSILESMLLYHRRVSNSDFSLRLGAIGYTLPIAKALGPSTFLSDAKIELQPILLSGLLLGFKYVPGRSESMTHMFHADLVGVTYAHNQILKNINSSYIARTGYKWYLNRRFALTADFTMKQFHSKYNEKINTKLWGLGIQLFLF